MPTITPQQFVAKWRRAELKERAGSQEHFIDLCRLLGHPTPAEADPEGEWFTFEAGATKQTGGQGWADVWKRGYFAWEYKGQHANLDKAYDQLLLYREALQNPPLLIVSDMQTLRIHTNFTNTVKTVHDLSLEELLDPARLDLLRHAFFEPERLKAPQTPEQVTQQAAAEFARLAEDLRKYADAPDSETIAHFLIRLLFCLFAEDVGLLPAGVFSKLIDRTQGKSKDFQALLQQLFAAMSTGGWFGAERILHFDGRLFDDSTALELDGKAMHTLARISRLDWSSIEPSIFGTLFERSLDPTKRSQLGAHYTSKEDILLIVEPVLMAPLRREWETVQAEVADLAAKRDAAGSKSAASRYQNQIQARLQAFQSELAEVQILDPACGSGNFLYVALHQLLDLWKEAATFAFSLGLPQWMPWEFAAPSPEQLHGIELNPYAYELAPVTIWIGYIQWMRDNGYGFPSEPILKPLDTIRRMDAILAYDEKGQPVEPAWPAADIIIGNPPFLGGNKVRQELGDKYVEALFALYEGRVPAFADLVCYWFERARAQIAADQGRRAGLLATNSIRGGANRKVLERIKETGDIFWAISDRDWILEGAAVNVSMVGFDDGSAIDKQLDSVQVDRITSDLQSGVDLTKALKLQENANIAFIGDTKKGKFDIPAGIATTMLSVPTNPNGKLNNDVIRPWINGLDITQRPRGFYIIDFGVDMPESEAALYEIPFEYVRKHVKPQRDKVRNPREKRLWWIHGRPAPDFRDAVQGLTRYIATARVAKHRIFVYVPVDTLPDGQVVAFARQDDYFFGVLHSRPHEIWALRQGTSLEDRPRYSQTFTFQTFPFPWPPGTEPSEEEDARVGAIAEAARELVEKRQRWLNPGTLPASKLKKRTLTNLYNQNPTWLQQAHEKLDRAVFDAYGWEHDLDDEAILERLLALNLERAGASK